MTDTQQPADTLDWDGNNTRKVPSGLNTLTILTFIACGLGVPGAIYGYFASKSSLVTLQEMQNKVDEMPAFAKKLMGPDALEVAQKSYDNRLAILLLSLLSMGLCIYGAIQMRKLKKDGFYIYITGELLPIPLALIFIGGVAFGVAGIFTYILLPALFIILYATQLKRLS